MDVTAESVKTDVRYKVTVWVLDPLSEDKVAKSMTYMVRGTALGAGAAAMRALDMWGEGNEEGVILTCVDISRIFD